MQEIVRQETFLAATFLTIPEKTLESWKVYGYDLSSRKDFLEEDMLRPDWEKIDSYERLHDIDDEELGLRAGMSRNYLPQLRKRTNLGAGEKFVNGWLDLSGLAFHQAFFLGADFPAGKYGGCSCLT